MTSELSCSLWLASKNIRIMNVHSSAVFVWILPCGLCKLYAPSPPFRQLIHSWHCMHVYPVILLYFCTGGWWTCERVDWNWEKELFLRGAYTFIHNIIHLCTVHVHCTCTCMCSVLELSVQDLNFNVVERSNYFLLSYGFHSPLITRTFAVVSMMLLMCWWQWTSFPRRKRRLSG